MYECGPHPVQKSPVPSQTYPTSCQLQETDHRDGYQRSRADGVLDLAFSCGPQLGTRTRLHVRSQQPPLRVIRAFPQTDGGVLTHLHNVSGGILGGDQLTVSATLGESTQVQLTSTGATRVYRHRAGYVDATQTTQLAVGPHALLEYLPDPLIPFAGARYRQQTTIDLADGAGLFYWEVVAPGREAHDESFAYESVNLSLDITVQNEPILIERMALQPTVQPLTSLARLGAYRYFGTFYICKVGVPPKQWLELEAQLMALANQRTLPETILWGVSTLPAHGLTVRTLSMNNRDISEGLIHFWNAAKQALYGKEAVLPRKVY